MNASLRYKTEQVAIFPSGRVRVGRESEGREYRVLFRPVGASSEEVGGGKVEVAGVLREFVGVQTVLLIIDNAHASR